MASPDLHRILLHPLHQTGLAYTVTGAVAAIAYGEPRMTNDVKLVVRLEPGDAEALTSASASPEYHVPPLQVIEEVRQRPRCGHLNVIPLHTAL